MSGGMLESGPVPRSLSDLQSDHLPHSLRGQPPFLVSARQAQPSTASRRRRPGPLRRMRRRDVSAAVALAPSWVFGSDAPILLPI
jgi:hypothetical protein